MSDGNFGAGTSRFKLVVYLRNQERQVFYSLTNEDAKGDSISLSGMVRRLLERRFRGRYMTAIIYRSGTDTVVRKYVNGTRVE